MCHKAPIFKYSKIIFFFSKLTYWGDFLLVLWNDFKKEFQNEKQKNIFHEIQTCYTI